MPNPNPATKGRFVMRLGVSGYDCQDCMDAGIAHTIEDVPHGVTDIYSTWGAGVPTTLRQCSNCKRTDGPWVSADLVGGYW